MVWQPSLLAVGQVVSLDAGFSRLHHIELDQSAWVDHVPEWVSGADRLFEEVLAARDWGQRSRRMYDRKVREPRLTAPWSADSGEPLEPPVLEEIREVLSRRYERVFDSVGFNLYRDGNDSVAWHGDRVANGGRDAVVVIVSLGEPRPFLLRPRGGGPSLSLAAGGGDLVVMGGDCQRECEHCVPKVARAGPRLSVTFRHGPLRPVRGRVTRVVEPTRPREGRHR